MSEVQALPVAEVDYKWPDDELVVRLSDYDALAAECERLRAECQRLDDKYERDAWGLNNEGDAIGGEPAGGFANNLLRTVGERDAALAELAALKGGQEAVAWRMWNGKTWRFCYSDLHGKRGWEALYTAPPAQASAWVAVSERLPEIDMGAPEYARNVRVIGWREGWREPRHLCYNSNGYAKTEKGRSPRWEGLRGCLAFSEPTHWQPLPTAPTPGASDGKGGKP